MSDTGHSNGHGTLGQRIDDLRQHVDVLAGRIEQVQGEVISDKAAVRDHHDVTLGLRDRLAILAGVQSSRFEHVGAELRGLHAKMDSLMAIVEAKARAPKRRAKR